MSEHIHKMAMVQWYLQSCSDNTSGYLQDIDDLVAEFTALREQRDALVELTTTLMSYAAKDEDESKSILGYAIYAPPWLIRDLAKALAKAEKDSGH